MFLSQRFSLYQRLLCAFSVIVVLTACSEESIQANDVELRPVRTITVGTADMNNIRTFPGVVDANQKATLSFRVSGKLQKLAVREGEKVEEGAVLAQLDDSDYQIQLAEAKASYDRAKSDYDRAKQLVGKGHVSKSDFDKITSALASAKAHLDASTQKVAYSTLSAPFSGQIAKRYVENFQDVGASQPIFLLQDLSSLEIRVDIPSSLMVNAQRDRSHLDLFAEFDAVPGKRFPLAIKEVATVADEVTQTYAVAMTMDNIDELLILPGMTGIVSAAHKTGTDQPPSELMVPSHSVLGDSKENFVWVAEPIDENHAQIQKRVVQVGQIVPSGLQILSGLKPGELVVTAGVSQLAEGQQVRLLAGNSQ